MAKKIIKEVTPVSSTIETEDKKQEAARAATLETAPKPGTIKWAAQGTKDGQKAINSMDNILSTFKKVLAETTEEEREAYRQAYVSVCKMAGTASSAGRASEMNRLFKNYEKDLDGTLEILNMGFGYHATIAKLPKLTNAGKPKAVAPVGVSTSAAVVGKQEAKVPQKHKTADSALATVFDNLKLVHADNGTCKALLNAVLGMMEQSKAEYLVELAAVLSTEWEAFEESHDEAKGTVGVMKIAA